MFDTAEAYASGKSEEEMQVLILIDIGFIAHANLTLGDA